jgi:hypothetical protein
MINIPDPSNSKEVVLLRQRADAARDAMHQASAACLEAREQRDLWDRERAARAKRLLDVMDEADAAERAYQGALERAHREAMLAPAGAR